MVNAAITLKKIFIFKSLHSFADPVFFFNAEDLTLYAKANSYHMLALLIIGLEKLLPII